ncbi:MAG: Ribosome biogenesis GTPase A [Thermoanaerobacterales bacterium 50_218]|nr:MAG: Ribosome biogenesis GTPase A [Thermoanaerobacterales bacterium 50_218]HAA90215.1 ribosome biogenesis GTPase YlqF [Peptococcaceae bacterium]
MKRLCQYIKVVDLVFEVVDARCPLSSRSPQIEQLAPGKSRLLVLNKADLADPSVTEKWLSFFRQAGEKALAVDSREGKGFRRLSFLLENFSKEVNEKLRKKGRKPRELRAAVVGVPNVGKSTFINRLIGRRIASVGNRPGITKGPQWIRVGKVFLLDTPGMLPPRLESEGVIFKLAAVGVLKMENYDVMEVANRLLQLLEGFYPGVVGNYFGITPGDDLFLEQLALKKKFLLPDGVPDQDRAARFLLELFQEGRLGALTLERPC